MTSAMTSISCLCEMAGPFWISVCLCYHLVHVTVSICIQYPNTVAFVQIVRFADKDEA